MGHQSELHAWFGSTSTKTGTSCFVGTLNDQTTAEDLITADKEHLQDCKDNLLALKPELNGQMVVERDAQDPNETCLRHVDGGKFLSFFRNV